MKATRRLIFENKFFKCRLKVTRNYRKELFIDCYLLSDCGTSIDVDNI